jgi:hypothetical protein
MGKGDKMYKNIMVSLDDSGLTECVLSHLEVFYKGLPCK